MSGDNKKLAKYLHKEILNLKWKNRGELLQELTPNVLEFWIGQFKTRNCIGHSEWSERYQKNIWVSDYEE
jgi:hypothetical protein